MKKTTTLIIGVLLTLLFLPSPTFSQTIENRALNAISYSILPYQDKKGVLFPNFWGVDSPIGVPDKLYNDLQCTQYIQAGNNEDLSPALYLKIKVPNTNFIIGALTYGGATDYRTDQLFISDTSGNIKSTLECTVLNGNISIKQYQITKDCKVIVSQLILTSKTPILYENFIGTNQSIEAYRLDTTYSISKDGKFIKEKETRMPTKSYTEKQLTNYDIWDL